MASTHSEIIISAAEQLATISDEGKEKISNEMSSMASREMSRLLGDTLYSTYVKSFSDPTYEYYVGDYDRTEEFYLLTDNERNLKNHEMAEAYLLLYYLVPALKELEEAMAISPKTTFGDGQIIGSSVDEISKMRQEYYSAATSLINQITETNGFFTYTSNES